MRRIVAPIIATALVLLAGCHSKPAVEAKRFEIHGKVVSVDKGRHEVTLAHESIPGYMQAMTMPFRVKDDWALDVMQPGDTVNATLVVAGEASLENISVTKATGAPAPGQAGAHEPSVGEQVPDFALVNQDGKRMHLRELRGKIVLLTFIYTRCPLPDYCIRMSNNFAETARELKKDPSLYDRVRLLSVSIDPEFDKSAVLKQYGRNYAGDIDPSFSHWQFVSGDPDEVRKMAEWFGLVYMKENNQIVHSLRTAVLDPDGKVADIFQGNGWTPAQAVDAIRSVLK